MQKLFSFKIKKLGFLKGLLKTVGQVTKYTFSAVLILVGIIGLTVSYINPMQFIAPYLPLKIEGTIIAIDQALVQSWLTLINANLIASVAISSTLLLMGILVHVRNFKTWWLNLRKTPMGIVRLPIRAYKRTTIWRNWLLAKVAYLNEESAKWKMTFKIMLSPYSLLRACGFSPQMAVGLIFAGSTVGTGVVVNETILADRSFKNGDAGVYAAPVDAPSAKLEEMLAFRKENKNDNTLRIVLGVVPVREIKIENVSAKSL